MYKENFVGLEMKITFKVKMYLICDFYYNFMVN